MRSTNLGITTRMNSWARSKAVGSSIQTVSMSPERASLGTLLGQARGDVLTGAWWTLVFPAAALILTALTFSAAGASLRQRNSPPTGQVW